jgi:type IV pilus assembly protein PilQ
MKNNSRKIFVSFFHAICFLVLLGLSYNLRAQTEEDLEREFEAAEGTTTSSSAPTQADSPPTTSQPSSVNSQTKPTIEDEFAEFDELESKTAAKDEEKQAKASTEEKPNSQLDQNQQPKANQPNQSQQPQQLDQIIEEIPQEQKSVTQDPPPPAPQTTTPVPPSPQVQTEQKPAAVKKNLVRNIRYQPNSNGGTVLIDAEGPIDFTTRKNTDTNQFIIEINNAKLGPKLKWPIDAKDISGPYGVINAYQEKGSDIARIVIQLRDQVDDPVLQQEGNTLLVIAQKSSPVITDTVTKTEVVEPTVDDNSSKVLSNQTLDEFLASNNQFYGKKISIEVNDMDIKEFIRFISDESGINLLLDDTVNGKVTIKLRQIPWDQALVIVLKSKRLGYIRTGNVIRIASMADLQKEDDDLSKLADTRKANGPVQTKLYALSYVGADAVSNQIRPYLSKRGSILADNRISSIVVSDTQDIQEKITALIKTIDIAPHQVLIEGKIVEASEKVSHQFGINWGFSGQDFRIGSQSGRNITGGLNFGIAPTASPGGTFGLNFRAGTFDFLGDINASIGFAETEGIAKIVSSPRIVALNNEAATITQQTQIPYLTSTITAAGVPSNTVNFQSVTLNLSVTPQINNDGSVILTTAINRANPGEQTSSGAVSVSSRSASTKVMIKNGQTAVIAGIYQFDTNESLSKVPMLADIPILGWLFKDKKTSEAKTELMIFLTPKILSTGDNKGMAKKDELSTL